MGGEIREQGASILCSQKQWLQVGPGIHASSLPMSLTLVFSINSRSPVYDSCIS